MAIDSKKIAELRKKMEAAKLREWPEPNLLALAAIEALPALLAERDEMLDLLREVQWKGCGCYEDERVRECPICGEEPERHTPDCRLAAFVKDHP